MIKMYTFDWNGEGKEATGDSQAHQINDFTSFMYLYENKIEMCLVD